MAEAGHSLAHFLQPTHFSPFTWAMTPFQMEMAPKGHTSRQLPQATQFLPTWANLFPATPFLLPIIKQLSNY